MLSIATTTEQVWDEGTVEGIDFFSAGLRDIPFDFPVVSHGPCAVHHGLGNLYRFNNGLVCRGCIMLRQSYPIRLKDTSEGRTRLGLGSFMLITTSSTEYWGKHVMPAGIKTYSAMGALRNKIRDLILNPPDPPWMFIAFARSNSPDRLRVTASNDLMQFSGKFFMPGTKGDAPVERLNRKQVIDLHSAADLTKEQWEHVIRSHGMLHSSPEALAYLKELYQAHPKLAAVPMPIVRTPEYHALRLIAEAKSAV